MSWKGIVLAGGSGTRLYPVTRSISKQLLPVYDKPMIYYPLSVLMLAGIRDIIIITTQEHLHLYHELLLDGAQWGCVFTYVIQDKPGGIAEAFTITDELIAGHNVCLVLGDNVFYGHGMGALLENAMKREVGATVFGYHVRDPERYGVVEFNETGQVLSVEEKPKIPKSSYAVTGLYFFDQKIRELARSVKPSPRGELEITDIINKYMEIDQLRVELIGRGIAWLDTGTHDSLLSASCFVQSVESRQGLKVACLEEIAWRKGFITPDQVRRLAVPLSKTGYGEYLLEIVDQVSYKWK